jgi:syntaxin 16
MQQTVIKKITEFTKKFKVNQEIYSKKYKELVGEDDPTFQINTSSKKDNNEANNTFDNFLMTQDNNSILMRRDTQLSELLNSVTDLAEMFKDMQNLVMEQGSILDRIDYNIDIASTNVVKGKNSLIKANDYHKNNCFRNVIIVLLICIFIEAFMLIFKFIK